MPPKKVICLVILLFAGTVSQSAPFTPAGSPRQLPAGVYGNRYNTPAAAQHVNFMPARPIVQPSMHFGNDMPLRPRSFRPPMYVRRAPLLPPIYTGRRPYPGMKRVRMVNSYCPLIYPGSSCYFLRSYPYYNYELLYRFRI